MNKILTYLFSGILLLGIYLYFTANNAYTTAALALVMIAMSTSIIIFIQDDETDNDIYKRWIV